MASSTTGGSGFGATIVGVTTTPTANIRSITVAGITRSLLDTTVHGTASGWQTFVVPGIQDSGEVTLECVYEETTFTKFETAVSAATEQWTITLSAAGGSSTFIFTGGVTSVSQNTPYDDIMTYDVTIKITGAIAYTGT